MSPVFKQGFKINEVALSKIQYEGTQTILVTFDSKKKEVVVNFLCLSVIQDGEAQGY